MKILTQITEPLPASIKQSGFDGMHRRSHHSIMLGLLLLVAIMFGQVPLSKAQDITFSETSLVFDANVDDFDFQMLDITNNSAVTITISSVTFTGTGASEFAFSGGNNGDPPYVMPTSGFESSIMAQISFGPTSAGTKIATLNVFSDSPESPHTLSIIGTSEVAIEPVLDISIANQPSGATVFDNLSVNVGEPDTITATIRNLGNTNLNISDLQLTGSTSQFLFVPNYSLPLAIAPLDSVVITIQAVATYPISIPSPGIVSINANFIVTHDDPNETSPWDTNLKFFERAPDPVSDVSELDFGNVAIGTDSTLSFTITNNSINPKTDGDLFITGFDFGTEADLFSSSSVFPIPLAIGESTSLDVTFSPDVFETISSSITVLGNVDMSLDVLGQGAIKQLSLGSSIVDFGDINRDDNDGQASSSVSMTANGGLPVTITNISYSGPDASSFFSSTSFLPIESTGGRSIFFLPGRGGKGVKNATMTITSDAINSPHVVEITANAIYPPILTTSTQLISIELDRLESIDTTFIVSNTGTETLNINSYSFGSSSSTSGISFVDYPSFPIALGDGEELPITVRFSPTGVQDLFAEVNIVSGNNSTGVLNVVSLQANMVFPIAFISDEFSLPLDSLRFGDVSTAVGKTDSINVVNEGTGDLVITEIIFSGSAAGDFTLPSVSYPITIGANDSSRIAVKFAPSLALSRPAKLTLVGNNVPENITVGLAGKGIKPQLSFNSSPLVGQVPIGSTAETIQEIVNFSDVPATIYGFELSGENASLFSISGIETPMILEAGDAVSLNISFTPLTGGAYTAQLEMVSDAVNAPLIATLNGGGIDTPIFYLGDSIVTEENVTVGTQKTIKIGVENKGNLDLVLTSAGFEIGSSGAFSSGTNGFGLPLTIPPGGVDSLECLFSPVFGGTYESVLSVLTNDDFVSEEVPSNRARINMKGIALGPEPVYSVTELDFDSTFVEFDKRLGFRVTNEGETELRMDFVYPHPDSLFTVFYVGYDAPTVPESFIPLTVAPGASQNISVVFRPIALGALSDSISLVLRNAKNERFYEKIPVKGIGVEPPLVKIGALTIVGDDFEREGNIKRLIGNVHVGDLQLGEEVIVDLAKNTLDGDGNVFVTEVPPNGSLAGGTVTLRTGGFKYYVNGIDSTLSVNENDAKGFNLFEVIGLTLNINDLTIAEGGVRAGGAFALPEVVFGPDAGFNLDKVFISKESGINIAGKFAIESPLTVFDVFSLESVELEFDSFNNCFSGAGSIASEGTGFELSIDASVVLKNGGLDGVALEVETNPGIPLGNTGFALAGGNGSIGGLQVPPLSLSLGVDLIPVLPAAAKVVRINNMGFEYTFGTSFTAGGTLQLFDMDVASASINGTPISISAEAFFSLLEIFKGGARISVQPYGEKLTISGNANLAYTIPALQDGFPDFIREVVNNFLPITLAEVSASFNEERITGAAVIPPVPVKISATITLIDDKPTITFGAELTLINNPDEDQNARMRVKELPYEMHYENNHRLAKQSHLEGQSIVIDSRISPAGRSLETVESTEFPFSLNESLESVIIRVAGVSEVPTFSLILPTGQEVNENNAYDMGYAHTVYEAGNKAFIVLTNTLPGDYIIKIDGSGEFEIDIAGAEFGPSLKFNDVNLDETTEEVEINWEDEDLDSDATISLYYDNDQKGADGNIITTDISEDDTNDQFIWDASSVDNGMYYVYGIIDDGKNLPTTVYATEPIIINRASAITVPVLENPVTEGTEIKLTWSATTEAEDYLVYYAEDGVVSLNSKSYNAGGKSEFTFPNLPTGRDYEFAVVVVDIDGIHSNLSNVVSLTFVSETENNVPNISSDEIPNKVNVGEKYEASIIATDGDAEDVLTYTLTTFPAGMTVTGNVISWTPTNAQIGNNQVALKVQDPSLASDSVSFTITVNSEKSSMAFISFNSGRFNGLDEVVKVTLTDPGLNMAKDMMESQEVTVFSSSNTVGTSITLTETSTNSGLFVGSFGFNTGENLAGKVGVSTADSVFVSYQDSYPNEEVKRFVLFEASETPNIFPTSVSLNNKIVRKEVSTGDLIGLLSTEDTDDDTHTYELVSGVGSDHNNLFKIDGQSLVVDASLANITDATINVRVRARDSKNGFYEQNFELINEAILAVEKDDFLLNKVTLYPNPTSRKAFVNINSERGAINLTVLSSDGRRIKTESYDKRWNDSKVSINVSDLPAGTYFIQIEQNGQVVNKRLIKN